MPFLRQKSEEVPNGCVKNNIRAKYNKCNFTETESPRHETCLHPLSDSIAKNIITALRRIRRRKRSEQSLVIKNEEEEPCYRNGSYLPVGLVRNFRSFKTEAWE